jgi:hypothetical protein
MLTAALLQIFVVNELKKNYSKYVALMQTLVYHIIAVLHWCGTWFLTARKNLPSSVHRHTGPETKPSVLN